MTVGPRLVIKQSPTKNSCVHTETHILAGSHILNFRGPLKSSKEVAFEDTTHCLEIADGYYLTSSGELDDLVNHSCTPNCGLRFRGVLGSQEIVLVALRDIDAGEELTFDYSTYLSGRFEPFACACATTQCRGKVGAFKDLDPPLKAHYLSLEIVAPYLSQCS